MKKAFTALELIIVVTVILILMGMLMPVLAGARKRARKKLTSTEMQGICMALELYMKDTGEYPPDNSDYSAGNAATKVGAEDSMATSLYYYLCGPEGKGLQIPGDDRVYGPFTNFKAKQLRRRGAGYVLVDPWGNPYIYEEHRSFFSSKTATRMTPFEREQEAVKRRAHNKMGYDLISMGPNGELDVSRHDMIDNDTDGVEDEEGERAPGEDEPDDVTNW